jgi:hypothetical protein
MSLQAFGSRRVTQSLRALAKYLDDGARIAAGIPPGQVLSLDLDDVPTTVSPRLTSVLWDLEASEGGPAPSVEFDELTDPMPVVVTGTNLPLAGSTNPITLFKLARPGVGTRVFQAAATDITEHSATGFKALLHQVPATGAPFPVGSYDALIVNAAGQTFLLQDACSIEPAGSYFDPRRTTDRPPDRVARASSSASRRG